jgi:hypothetical protein
MWFIVLTNPRYNDETTSVRSTGKITPKTILEESHAMFAADLEPIGGADPAGTLLNMLAIFSEFELLDLREVRRAFGSIEHRQDVGPGNADAQFTIWNNRGGNSGNLQKVRDEIPNLGLEETHQEWSSHLVGILLAFLRDLAAGREALAALDTDLASTGPNGPPEQLDQLDDQPPTADAAIVSLIAAPAAPPRLLTAA